MHRSSFRLTPPVSLQSLVPEMDLQAKDLMEVTVLAGMLHLWEFTEFCKKNRKEGKRREKKSTKETIQPNADLLAVFVNKIIYCSH